MLRRRENHSPAITINQSQSINHNQSQSITPPLYVVGDERNVEEREPIHGDHNRSITTNHNQSITINQSQSINHNQPITINQSQSITPPVYVVGDERNVEEREPIPGDHNR